MKLVRIVKLTFKEEHIEEFKLLFKESEDKIRNFAGCNSMDGYQDQLSHCIFFTYSIWDSPESLENYRKSILFKDIWTVTRQYFSIPAEAWSLQRLD